MRKSRKMEHIQWALGLQDGPLRAGFEDIKLVHNALPEIDHADISLATEVFGCALEAPILINAMTGGNPQVMEINRCLARAACKAGIGMAVGSQTGAILDNSLVNTYNVVREENPHGLIIANVGANLKAALALQAVEMIRANALQVHLNPAQELAMSEGDRDFRGILDNIQQLVQASPVPVIVKEVGFGMTREVVTKLQAAGVCWVDIGGSGGTNFVAIEHQRGQKTSIPEDWGIATAASLAEISSAFTRINVVASGGIRTPLDAVKALSLEASLVGIAGLWLKILLQQSYEDLVGALNNFKSELKRLMLLLGAPTLNHLAKVPLVITGATGEWLRERGVNTGRWAQRNG